MPEVPFHYVDVRSFAYATEDAKRVEGALRHFLPEAVEVDRERSAGHHGDRIDILSARIENADDVRYALSRLADLPDLGGLVDELDDRVTEHTEFFLHLDKQAAFRGETARGEGITFRAKVEAYPAKREKAVANARETLEALEAHEVRVPDPDVENADATGDGQAADDGAADDDDETDDGA
jgi:RNA binding exosome subunit